MMMLKEINDVMKLTLDELMSRIEHEKNGNLATNSVTISIGVDDDGFGYCVATDGESSITIHEGQGAYADDEELAIEKALGSDVVNAIEKRMNSK